MHPSITKISLKITCLKFYSNLPGANELNKDHPDNFELLYDENCQIYRTERLVIREIKLWNFVVILRSQQQINESLKQDGDDMQTITTRSCEVSKPRDWMLPGLDRFSLRWRHNGGDGVSNHQPHHCLLNRLFRRRSKKTSKFRVTGLCVGNSHGTGEFHAQMASNAENVSIWWRHHVNSTSASATLLSKHLSNFGSIGPS